MWTALACTARRRFLAVSTAIAIGTLSFGALNVTASSSTAPPRTHINTATMARRMSITEIAHMRLASTPGVTIKEQGPTTGTFKGTVVSYFTSYSVTTGSLILTAYLPGGSVTVRGASSNRVVGSTGYAEGTAHITRGTGRFAHASSSGLKFRATVNRRNFYITAELSGPLSL